jgi:hypothetical protein
MPRGRSSSGSSRPPAECDRERMRSPERVAQQGIWLPSAGDLTVSLRLLTETACVVSASISIRNGRDRYCRFALS